MLCVQKVSNHWSSFVQRLADAYRRFWFRAATICAAGWLVIRRLPALRNVFVAHHSHEAIRVSSWRRILLSEWRIGVDSCNSGRWFDGGCPGRKCWNYTHGWLKTTTRFSYIIFLDDIYNHYAPRYVDWYNSHSYLINTSESEGMHIHRDCMRILNSKVWEFETFFFKLRDFTDWKASTFQIFHVLKFEGFQVPSGRFSTPC